MDYLATCVLQKSKYYRHQGDWVIAFEIEPLSLFDVSQVFWAGVECYFFFSYSCGTNCTTDFWRIIRLSTHNSSVASKKTLLFGITCDKNRPAHATSCHPFFYKLKLMIMVWIIFVLLVEKYNYDGYYTYSSRLPIFPGGTMVSKLAIHLF